MQDGDTISGSRGSMRTRMDHSAFVSPPHPLPPASRSSSSSNSSVDILDVQAALMNTGYLPSNYAEIWQVNHPPLDDVSVAVKRKQPPSHSTSESSRANRGFAPSSTIASPNQIDKSKHIDTRHAAANKQLSNLLRLEHSIQSRDEETAKQALLDLACSTPPHIPVAAADKHNSPANSVAAWEKHASDNFKWTNEASSPHCPPQLLVSAAAASMPSPRSNGSSWAMERTESLNDCTKNDYPPPAPVWTANNTTIRPMASASSSSTHDTSVANSQQGFSNKRFRILPNQKNLHPVHATATAGSHMTNEGRREQSRDSINGKSASKIKSATSIHLGLFIRSSLSNHDGRSFGTASLPAVSVSSSAPPSPSVASPNHARGGLPGSGGCSSGGSTISDHDVITCLAVSPSNRHGHKAMSLSTTSSCICCHDHPGTVQYRRDFAVRHCDYARAKSNEEKLVLSQELFATVWNRQGRFWIHEATPLNGDDIGTSSSSSSSSLRLMDAGEIEQKILRDFLQPCFVATKNTERDVCLGRGAQCTNHAGHQHFLNQKDVLRPLYVAASNNVEKTRIAQDLVDWVYDNGGRILTEHVSASMRANVIGAAGAAQPPVAAGVAGAAESKDKVNSNQWYIVDNATALKTAKQKLRESRKGRPQAKNNSARTSFNGAAAATVSGAVGGTTCRTTMVASSTETVPS